MWSNADVYFFQHICLFEFCLPLHQHLETQKAKSVQGIQKLLYTRTEGLSFFVLFVCIRQNFTGDTHVLYLVDCTARTNDCGNCLSSATRLVQQGQWET